MSQGIDFANEELINNGRTDTPWVEVLLSDGNNNCGSEDPPVDCHQRVFDSAQEAADNGIVIYTIALGNNSNQSLMEEIANITGGKSYYAPDSDDLEEIYEEIAEEVTTIAGTNIVVIDYLPGYVELNESTLPPECTYDDIERKITCELDDLHINETATVTFNIYLHQFGYILTNVYPDSGVEYLNYNGTTVFEEFPETYVTSLDCDHTVCNYIDMTCDLVLEPGDDECETFDDCPQHTECDYVQQACVTVQGIGKDECETYDDCFHTECSEGYCIDVQGVGIDQCETDTECRHFECNYVDLICEEIFAVGASECQTFRDCPQHTECDYQLDQCVTVEGAGEDQCLTYSDCLHTECNYVEFTCDTIESQGIDECVTFEDCPQHKECDFIDELCIIVEGAGVDECQTFQDCYYCGNGILEPGEECETTGNYSGWGPWGHEYTCKEDNTYYHCVNCQYEHVNECEYYCSGDIGCDGIPPMTYLDTCTAYGYDYLQDYCNEICELEDNDCEDDYFGCTSDPQCDELAPNTGDCNYMCQYKPSHTECNYQAQTCDLVQGPGVNECVTFEDCEQHTECDYQLEQCVLVGGPGDDECSTYSDCIHSECNYVDLTCDIIEAPGTYECIIFDDCPQHTECDYVGQACVIAEGEEADECITYNDCLHTECNYIDLTCDLVETPGIYECETFQDCPHHTVCDYIQQACVTVEGIGKDECSTYNDCIHTECNYVDLTCDTIQSSGIDECVTFEDCPQHKVCDYQLEQCVMVEGSGIDECSVWEDCLYCGDGTVTSPEECELPGTSSNPYCTCPQDGCIGVNYYDYPAYGDCLGDCTCGGCEPTEYICDERCMGDCEVEVKTGHDMNPQWPPSPPYTATDDIWIMATDVSNGACDGLTIRIRYWWCSCPNKDPEQSAIEYSQSPKYDRLCSANAAGEDNPTHSLECAPCEWRNYYAKFPQDSGKKFWTGVGGCEGTFQIDIRNYHDCYERKYPVALACTSKCEDEPVHLECKNKMCQEVLGSGDDLCSVDSDCYFYKCVDQACVKRGGTQADQCATDADCVAAVTHLECSGKQCVQVAGSDQDQCSQDCDCYFYKCDYTQQACVKRAGTQADQCSVWEDCIHNECMGFTCETVFSPGLDECYDNWDCEPEPPEPPEPPIM